MKDLMNIFGYTRSDQAVIDYYNRLTISQVGGNLGGSCDSGLGTSNLSLQNQERLLINIYANYQALERFYNMRSRGVATAMNRIRENISNQTIQTQGMQHCTPKITPRP